MRLRSYECGDEGALVELWFESWRSVGLDEPGVTKADLAERFPRELSARWKVTVAEEDGTLVGFLAVCLAETKLDQLFIAPNRQRRGVGSALLEAAKGQMPKGFWLSTQRANRRAREFYERRGMSIDRTRSGAVRDRVYYQWPAAPPSD